MPPKEDPKAPTPAVGASSFISGLVTSTAQQRAAATPPSVTPPLDAELEQSIQASEMQAEVEQSYNPDALRANFERFIHQAPPIRTIACMVTHGMGQQVPFDTAASIGDAFVRGRQPASVQANRVQLTDGADLLSRLELVYPATATDPETHVHIYEGYWAPLTEGKISYAQALGFLWSGAVSGISTTIKRKFDRWIFGDIYDLPVKKHTLTTLLLVVLVLGIGLLLAFLGGLQITHFYDSLKPLAKLPFLEIPAALLKMVLKHWQGAIRTAVLVALAFVYRYFLNLFIIEYLGDVAIYVSSYKVSAFQQIRDAIQKTVLNVGQQIFQAKNSGDTPFYDGVIFVGHSLGSVITYDLINALIVWDTKGCDGQHNVVGRIHRLITFGSPLDKTAFLFRNQTSTDHHYREAMAGLMQALVLDYSLRPFPWINLYSHLDIVSGSLEYYDTPANKPHPAGRNPVQNLIDPFPSVPILAHIQYWNGPTLSAQLLAGLAPPV